MTATDGMIVDYSPFPHEFFGRTATRIVDEVRGINRVVVDDISSKPPRHDREGVGRLPGEASKTPYSLSEHASGILRPAALPGHRIAYAGSGRGVGDAGRITGCRVGIHAIRIDEIPVAVGRVAPGEKDV